MSDWDSVTILRKRQDTTRTAKNQAALNAAFRSGAVVGTEKKFAAGSNKKGADEHQRLAKIDNSEDIVKVETVSISVGRAIQQGRQNKGLTQKELGQRINEKASVINDYEAGRAVPNQQVISKLERALGIKLRGKNIGEPLGPSGKKK